jgi:hypothetical protein
MERAGQRAAVEKRVGDELGEFRLLSKQNRALFFIGLGRHPTIVKLSAGFSSIHELATPLATLDFRILYLTIAVQSDHRK